MRHYLGLGFGGFRCDAAYKVPAEVWRGLTGAAKAAAPDVLFCAETVGAPEEAVLALANAGFDYLFNSVKWWDFKSPWLLDQYEIFRHIAPSIGFPESHDTERLVTELRAAGIPESEIAPRYRQAYAFAAAYSTGVLMPMGFEYGWGQRFAVVMGAGSAPEPQRFDLSRFIAEVNAMKQAIPALNEEGPQRRVHQRRRSLGDVGAPDRSRRRPRLHHGQSEPAQPARNPLGYGCLTEFSKLLRRRLRGCVEPLEVRVLRALSRRQPSARPLCTRRGVRKQGS